MKIQDNVNVTIHLHFTEEIMQAIKNLHGIDLGEILRTFEERVGSLENVVEVCTDHQMWVKLEPTATTWEGVQMEVALTNAAVLDYINNLI